MEILCILNNEQGIINKEWWIIFICKFVLCLLIQFLFINVILFFILFCCDGTRISFIKQHQNPSTYSIFFFIAFCIFLKYKL